MNLMVNPVITDFRQDVNGDIKMLKIGVDKEDAYANIIGQAESAKLENNKAATINVSTYTEPVEITPTAGKDGMKKATITLSNIPSGSLTLYCWKNNDTEGLYYTITTTPTTSNKAYDGNEYLSLLITQDGATIEGVGEGTITINETDYTRYSEGDYIFH